GLLSDTFNAIPMLPFFALAGQLDSQTKYMLELNWAPLVGAAVVRKKSWGRVPADAREAMLKIAAEVEEEWRATVEKVQDQIRGKIVPADVFDEAQRLLQEFRSSAGGKPK